MCVWCVRVLNVFSEEMSLQREVPALTAMRAVWTLTGLFVGMAESDKVPESNTEACMTEFKQLPQKTENRRSVSCCLKNRKIPSVMLFCGLLPALLKKSFIHPKGEIKPS